MAEYSANLPMELHVCRVHVHGRNINLQQFPLTYMYKKNVTHIYLCTVYVLCT